MVPTERAQRFAWLMELLIGYLNRCESGDVKVRPAIQSLNSAELRVVCEKTLGHYNSRAMDFWLGTRDHDVTQNVDALIRHLPPTTSAPRVLDFGCGPGRDLLAFKELGFEAIGLEGALEFVGLARENSGCEVLHQSFLELDLPSARFDGIFANASLFHVPSQELPKVLGELFETLKPTGVLFSSNPRGPNIEGWSGDRYSCYLDLDSYTEFMHEARFVKLEHYYRPPGRPCNEQPWLASVWEKHASSTDTAS